MIEVALKRGIFYPTAEKYGSIAGFWDYGPIGARIKRKFIEAWRRLLVDANGFVEIDGSPVLPAKVFEASGHLKNFVDPVVECSCGFIYRADKLIEEKRGVHVTEGTPLEEIKKLLPSCPKCGKPLSEAKLYYFNMMFDLKVGVKKDQLAYLRPETCQNIFVSFARIFKACRERLPLGVAQVGHSFRNEISPRNALVRLRDLTQAEIEIFYDEMPDVKVRGKIPTPTGEIDVSEIENKLLAKHLLQLYEFYSLFIPRDRIRFRKLEEEKPFYARESWDLEVKTSLGWLELVACNDRGDYDLKVHDVKVKGKYLNVVELSMGVDRSVYAILDVNFHSENRNWFKLHPLIAPYLAGIFPLVKKEPLVSKAKEIYSMLSGFDVIYDENDSIGRRYRRIDEIGVPFAITVDYQTLEDNTVTLRRIDTMEQERVKIEELAKVLRDSLCIRWNVN